MPTCGQASFIRAMPEKEKPPAMRVDIYLLMGIDDILTLHCIDLNKKIRRGILSYRTYFLA